MVCSQAGSERCDCEDVETLAGGGREGRDGRGEERCGEGIGTGDGMSVR